MLWSPWASVQARPNRESDAALVLAPTLLKLISQTLPQHHEAPAVHPALRERLGRLRGGLWPRAFHHDAHGEDPEEEDRWREEDADTGGRHHPTGRERDAADEMQSRHE